MIKKDSNSSKQVQETLVRREKPPKRDFSSFTPISEIMAAVKSSRDADSTVPISFSSETELPHSGIQASALELENANAELWHQQLEILNNTLFRLRLQRKLPDGADNKISDNSIPDTASQTANENKSELTATVDNKADKELPTLLPNGSISFGPLSIHILQHPEAMRLRIEFSHSGHKGKVTGSKSRRFTENSRALHVYGLGEKMGRMDRTGRVWEFWNTDDPDHLPSKDPLYVSIPFAVINSIDTEAYTDTAANAGGATEKPLSSWYGLFIDMPARQYWDICKTEENSIIIDTEDTYMNAYIFTGETPRQVISQFTALTGRMPLPPMWALGYHQSRYSYESAERVREVIDTFRTKDMPLDTVHLDIDYMNGYRVFTWNPEHFPSPAELARYASDQAVKLVTIVDPGIKADEEYDVYTEGRAKNFFCKTPDGKDYLGKVWPGISAFPDFSQSTVRSWWADLHARLFSEGVSGIWNDMNEPADFTGSFFDRTTYTVPENLTVNNDGSPAA
ncbi:MAG: hypothetical protein K9L75_02385, partial [Spirochaetia bacterium]|nr:hypothetical protein [Spirochaetia bacterium]